MIEVQEKIKKLRAYMQEQEIPGLSLKGVDWFSWITGGGRSTVIFTSETGIAEVLITPQHAFLLTNTIEATRLKEEEIPNDFELVSFPWAEQQSARMEFLKQQGLFANCSSDHPLPSEKKAAASLAQIKWTLSVDETNRYRIVSRLAAEAMTEALLQANPEWTENQLAGAGAESLWRRGLDPTLVLVGGLKRLSTYRHPVATFAKLGDGAMMVFCARGFGLYANLTRFIYFREPTTTELEAHARVLEVEKRVFELSVPGAGLRDIYSSLKEEYRRIGVADEINRHHQGGITGYLSREAVASLDSPYEHRLQVGMALAWNPSVVGAKIEDTVLLTEKGLEVLTTDPVWPVVRHGNLLRPSLWVKE